MLLWLVGAPGTALSQANNRIDTGIVDAILKEKLEKLKTIALRQQFEGLVIGQSVAKSAILYDLINGIFSLSGDLLANRLVSDVVILKLVDLRSRTISDSRLQYYLSHLDLRGFGPDPDHCKPKSRIVWDLCNLRFSKIWLKMGVHDEESDEFKREFLALLGRLIRFDPYTGEYSASQRKLTDERNAALIADYFDTEATIFSTDYEYTFCFTEECVKARAREEFGQSIAQLLRHLREDIAFLEVSALLINYKGILDSDRRFQPDSHWLDEAKNDLAAIGWSNTLGGKFVVDNTTKIECLGPHKAANVELASASQVATFSATNLGIHRVILSIHQCWGISASLDLAAVPLTDAAWEEINELIQSIYGKLGAYTPPTLDGKRMFHSQLVIRIFLDLRVNPIHVQTCPTTRLRCEPRLEVLYGFINSIVEYLKIDFQNDTDRHVQFDVNSYLSARFRELTEGLLTRDGLGLELGIGATGVAIQRSNLECSTHKVSRSCVGDPLVFYHEKIGARYVFAHDPQDSDIHVALSVGGLLFQLESRKDVDTPIDLQRFKVLALEFGRLWYGLLDTRIGYYYLTDFNGHLISSTGISFSFPLWEYLNAVK